jgi:hypothetical protein
MDDYEREAFILAWTGIWWIFYCQEDDKTVFIAASGTVGIALLYVSSL